MVNWPWISAERFVVGIVKIRHKARVGIWREFVGFGQRAMRVQFSRYVGHWLRNSVRTQFIWSGCDAFDMRHAVPSGGGLVDWSGACADTVRGSIRRWRAPRRCLRNFKLRIDRVVVLARGVCVVRPRGALIVLRAPWSVAGGAECRGVLAKRWRRAVARRRLRRRSGGKGASESPVCSIKTTRAAKSECPNEANSVKNFRPSPSIA